MQKEITLTINELKYHSRWKTGFVVTLVILVFSAVSTLSINQYRYGISDHCIAIPFFKKLLNSKLYPGDYLLAEMPYYLTYLWNILALLVKYLNVDVPALFFLSYCISIYMTFLAFYLVAMTLFGKREVAFLSLFFLLFRGPVLGGVDTLDVLLYTRVAVLPILLFSIYFFLKERHLLSFFLAGIGFLIHPLSTAYVIAILFVSSVFASKYIGARRFLLCVTILVISASPILIWKILYPPPGLGLLYADPRWIGLVRLRSSHHIFPFSWGKGTLFRPGLLLLVFFMSWKHRPRANYHRVVLCSTATIFALCMAGTVFTELLPLSIVIQSHSFRSSIFLVYFAMIYFANYFLVELQSRKNMFDKLLVAFPSIGILYAAGRWPYPYVAFFALTMLLILHYLICRRDLSPRYFVMALLVIVVGIGAYDRGSFSIDNAQDTNWLDVQVWAKQNTSLQDVFIVPPNWYSFRVESERTIYGDWKDGAMTIWSPAFGYEWFRRMKALGYKKAGSLEEGFKNLNETDFVNIANEGTRNGHKTFLIMFKERETLNFPITYANEKFVVYEVSL